MEVIKSSPILQDTAKTGKTKYWQAHIVTDGDNFYTQTSFYQDTKSGVSKKQHSDPYLCTPKNVGKKNETTSETQAEFEFTSMVQHRLDKGYHEKGKKSTALLKPMLAHKYKQHRKKLNAPYFIQPKLDGFRMLMNGTSGWTRGGKLLIPECIQHLLFDTKGYIIDGELILPHNPPLQQTARAAKKFYPEVSPTLLYRVYDVVIEDKTFEERYEILKELIAHAPPNVVLVETFPASSEEEVLKYHTDFIQQGVEGSIIRGNDLGYEIGNRSYNLLKHKDFLDAEFRIMRVFDGDGRMKNKAIFECITLDGEFFNVVPQGSMEYREELFNRGEELVGKDLTVRYQSLSNLGIPIFPVGVAIRDYE